jgi:uncharacterized RDD family membrane protein YckC
MSISDTGDGPSHSRGLFGAEPEQLLVGGSMTAPQIEPEQPFSAGEPPKRPRSPHPFRNQAALPHPWRRWLARTTDYTFTGILVGFASGFMGLKVFSGRSELVSGMILMVVHALIVEPFTIAFNGRTAGKALFNISVVNDDLSPLSLSQAFSRSLNVWARALAFGIPLISLFTTIHQYNELTKKGAASYDRDGGYRVTHGAITAGRVVLLIVAVVVFIALFAIGVAAKGR